MSIQAGIWNFDGAPADRATLARISCQITEYGPDGEAMHIDGSVGMLYRPFHTTLESRKEQQPHMFGSGSVITWDGRLDNREELISELGRSLRGQTTDISIVATAFEQWGTNCFARITGDWSLSLWDGVERELILARDYVGVKQLFYHRTSNRMLWCSNLLPLAQSGHRFSVSADYISGYLTLWPDSDITPYREILSVPPGHFVVHRETNTAVKSYWRFNRRLRIRYASDVEYEEHFRHLFRQSVRRRLRSDSSILAELSGGLDSSAIVCMADDIYSKEGRDNAVDTFSYYDPAEPEEEDHLYFPKVEEKRGRIGHHAELRGSGDTFCFDSSTFHAVPGFGGRQETQHFLQHLIRSRKYAVVLSGRGGDEVTGQASDFHVQLADLAARLHVWEFGKQLTEWCSFLRRPLVQVLTETLALLLPTTVRTVTRIGSPAVAKLEPWLERAFARQNHMEARLLSASEGQWWWLPSVRDSWQTYSSLARQMTHIRPFPLEKRYPYLDRDLVEFLLSIPPDQLLRPNDRRSLLRRALRDLLPAEILTRRTKASTGRCFSVTLQKHWERLQAILPSPVCADLGWLNRTHFQMALRDAKDGNTTIHIVRLLRGLAVEFWLRSALANGIISAPLTGTTRRNAAAMPAASKYSIMKGGETDDVPKARSYGSG